jgi:hypothetical protein
VFFLEHLFSVRHGNKELIKIDRTGLIKVDLVDDVHDLGLVMVSEMFLADLE